MHQCGKYLEEYLGRHFKISLLEKKSTCFCFIFNFLIANCCYSPSFLKSDFSTWVIFHSILDKKTTNMHLYGNYFTEINMMCLGMCGNTSLMFLPGYGAHTSLCYTNMQWRDKIIVHTQTNLHFIKGRHSDLSCPKFNLT